MELSETAQQFVVRLEEYVLRWMGLAKVEESFEGLKDLVLREQFMQSSSKNLQVFLKERKVSSVEEMAIFADQYIEAHGSITNPGKPIGQGKIITNDNSGITKPHTFPETSDRNRQCYVCRSGAHLAKDCPHKFVKSTRAGALTESEQPFNTRGNNLSLSSRGRQFHRRHFGRRGSYRAGYRGGRDSQSGNQEYDVGVRQYSQDSSDVGCFVQERVVPSEESVILDVDCESPFVFGSCSDNKFRSSNMPVVEGYLGDRKVKVLRDSGCSSVVVRRDLVEANCLTSDTQRCTLIDGTVRRFPIAIITVDTPFYTGTVRALCTEHPIYDLILGNIASVKDLGELDRTWKKKHAGSKVGESEGKREELNAAQTRGQKERDKLVHNLKVADCVNQIGVDEVKGKQKDDPSLAKARDKAKTKIQKVSKTGATSWFETRNDVLFRRFQSRKVENGKLFKQLCVPESLRTQVLKLAHDSVMGGHLGIRKTSDKILYQFWWPGIQADVKRYCRSCDICQKTFPKGKVTKIPIGELSLIETPFARVAVDLIGPINPPSEKGNRFILTLVDYATRYPEAIALKRIDTETVAEALVDMFSRVGVPSEILSDMGKQFTSDLMKEVGRLLSIRQLTTSPYNPQCNGLVERFNGTIKNMLKKMCHEQPRYWDRFISPLLFAYRETPQASLGFSPFELLYGRTVRGPLCILKEIWSKEIESDEVKTTYEYVVDLRNRLENTLEVARKELEENTCMYRKYANVGKNVKPLKAGDKVLVLLPTSTNKLLMHLQGPYEVTQRVNDFDYKVKVKGKEKIYHANLLRKYVERDSQGDGRKLEVVDRSEDVVAGMLELACVAVVEESEDLHDEGKSEGERIYDRELKIDLPSLQSKETVDDVQINPDLTCEQKKQLKELVEEFKDVFTDIPGHTDLIEHEIKLSSDTPVRSKPYPMPYAMRESFKSDIDDMLRLGIIEPVESPYASPVVIVKKPDGTNRVCIDYRKLNALTVFDSEPIGNADEIFARLSDSKFLSKIDLSKGYWQIKVKEECVPFTAFTCSEGLFAFKRMPFGLVNSGATFCKMMRKLLKGLIDIDNYVDDILDHSDCWNVHLSSLKELFGRLRAARLTARPSKCMLGFQSLCFMGHVVGNGQIQPNPQKVKDIENCQKPATKKQVRSFLGLVGYYRKCKFIPYFSTVASVLTDMVKKGAPNVVVWSKEAESSFRSLIGYVTRAPILCLPDVDKQFTLRTDASDTGIGAVLMQETSGMKFPIAYASRKLLPRETRYSVIEKEGLAIVWGVQKFQQYIYGTEFLLETDHAPLAYMNKTKLTNPRVMRWALSLQPYRFRVQVIKGSENVGADFLSRLQ